MEVAAFFLLIGKGREGRYLKWEKRVGGGGMMAGLKNQQQQNQFWCASARVALRVAL